MASFFNDIRMESGTFDENDVEGAKRSMSISRSMSTSNYGGPYNANMGPGGMEVKKVDFFNEVKPQTNTVHNFAFNDKFPEEERKKLATLCADMPQPVPIGFDDCQAISPAMVTMVDIYNISVAERKEILEKAAQDPETLLGWQVRMQYILLFVC